MKGYTLNNTMYVFPQTVGAIPYVGESVTSIMVQQEDLAAWKTANSDYASIMKAYNYNMMTVQKKVWADHLDDDIVVPDPEKIDPALAWSEEGATVTIDADDNVFPTLTNEYSVEVSYTSSATGVATIASDGTVVLVDAGQTTITASFDGNDEYEADTASYVLTVEAAAVNTISDNDSVLSISLVNSEPVESADLLPLYDYKEIDGIMANNFTSFIKDGTEPGLAVEPLFDETDPENPVYIGAQYSSEGGDYYFTVTYDGQIYTLTPYTADDNTAYLGNYEITYEYITPDPTPEP